MMKKEKPEESQKNQFDWSNTLFLEKLEYRPNMILDLHFIGGKKNPPEEIFIGNVKIGPVQEVVWDTSKRVIVRFYQPLTFQRLDESFAAEEGTYQGKGRFGTYSNSEYLAYYSKVTFGIVEEPIQHYCFICADDIISVLSTEEPEIEYVSEESVDP